MTITIRDAGVMQELRERRHEGGGLFQVPKGLAVLDAECAHAANATNFSDTTLPDRLVDLVRGRESPKIEWNEVRAVWFAQMKKLATAEHVAALEDRLRAEIDERLDQGTDLSWAIQKIFTRALIPTILADLKPHELRRVLADQDYKLARLMRTELRIETFPELVRSAVLQIRTGRVVRKVIKDRIKGRRPRRTDLTDPVIDLLPTLGMDRAAFSVTAVLTAIAGPPGAVATCMLLELSRRESWRDELAAELAAVDPDAFHASPTRTAPKTYRFVREVLRFWSSPLVLTRRVRTPLQIGDHELEVDRHFHVSPYFVHHDPEIWTDPEVFDPDRWLPKSDRGPRKSCGYVPFGWNPTSCVGATQGLAELILLCRLFSTEYRLEARDVDDVEVLMAAVPLPQGFRGTITRR